LVADRHHFSPDRFPLADDLRRLSNVVVQRTPVGFQAMIVVFQETTVLFRENETVCSWRRAGLSFRRDVARL
jgi:hypothetical protein